MVRARVNGRLLLLELAHVGDEGLGLLIRDGRSGLHQDLGILLETFLDGLDTFLILEGGLHLGIGIVARLQQLAGLGLAFAVEAVALGSISRMRLRRRS